MFVQYLVLQPSLCLLILYRSYFWCYIFSKYCIRIFYTLGGSWGGLLITDIALCSRASSCFSFSLFVFLLLHFCQWVVVSSNIKSYSPQMTLHLELYLSVLSLMWYPFLAQSVWYAHYKYLCKQTSIDGKFSLVVSSGFGTKLLYYTQYCVPFFMGSWYSTCRCVFRVCTVHVQVHMCLWYSIQCMYSTCTCGFMVQYM